MAKRLEKIEASQWMPAVGGRLRTLREVHGMTQLALSTAIHVDKSAWTKYEKGQQLLNP